MVIKQSGARLVTMSNLYGYAKNSSPMRATDPLDPPSTKGAIRVQMWNEALAAHETGRVRVTELRASDYFGPGLGDSAHLGDRFVPKAAKGKGVSVVGDPEASHSWTYIGDVCAMLAILGTDDRALGRAWHVPTVAPRSATHMVADISASAGVKAAKVACALIHKVGLLLQSNDEVTQWSTAPFT
jgi:nucleoside-diphosphate-sugar epimerase